MNEKQLKSSFTFNQVVKLLPLFSCSRFLFLFYFSTFLFRLNAWVRVFLSLPSFLRMIFRLHSETMVNEFFFYINNHKIKYWQNMSLASLNRCFQRNNVILIWQNFCVWIAFFTASIIISVLFFLHWPNPICCRLHWSALFDPIELWTCRFLVAVIKMNRIKKNYHRFY